MVEDTTPGENCTFSIRLFNQTQLFFSTFGGDWTLALLRLIIISKVVRVWVGGRNGGGGVPARQPTGMFSTSEPRAKMRQNNKAQWQIAEGGTRGREPDTCTCTRRSVLMQLWVWVHSENRAQGSRHGWKRLEDERVGLQIKALNPRDDVLQLQDTSSTTRTYIPLFYWKRWKTQ